jgi:hypothetical protein
MSSALRDAPSETSAAASARKLGRTPLTIEEVVALARGEARVIVDPVPDLRRRLKRSRQIVAAGALPIGATGSPLVG